MSSINAYGYREGDLLAVRIGTDYAATDRYAEVVHAYSYGEGFTLVGADGREITGNVVSARAMTEDEQNEWFDYRKENGR